MRSVSIAQFKGQLSRHLRQVQSGKSLLVFDRETPIARVIPIDAGDDLTITLPASDAPPVGKLKLPTPPRIGVDVVELLVADRRGNPRRGS
jgi:antitoxin (DNA-binding transcriptional repressor) of toxin-antitoxin stability system